MELHPRLQAQHLLEPLLAQNLSQVRLGDVVCKGAIAEDARGITGRREIGMPLADTPRECLYLHLSDSVRQADEQNAAAYGMDLFACNLAPLDRHTQV